MRKLTLQTFVLGIFLPFISFSQVHIINNSNLNTSYIVDVYVEWKDPANGCATVITPATVPPCSQPSNVGQVVPSASSIAIAPPSSTHVPSRFWLNCTNLDPNSLGQVNLLSPTFFCGIDEWGYGDLLSDCTPSYPASNMLPIGDCCMIPIPGARVRWHSGTLQQAVLMFE